MSTHNHSHSHGHGAVASHATLRGYLTGFGLSVVLTAIPFWLVMGHVLASDVATAMIIMMLAAIQVVVHMVYFLHMNLKLEDGWSFMALMFTLIMVVIGLTGSLWVMYHLNVNMMPMPAPMSAETSTLP